MKYIFIIIIFILPIGLIRAQLISTSAILATARKDVKYQSAIEMSKFTDRLNYALPLLQKVEVRYGADENGFNRNQYGIGLGFNPLAQRKAQFHFQAAQSKVFDKESEVSFRDALFTRYNSILQIVNNQYIIKEQTQLFNLLSQKKVLFGKMLDVGQEVKMKDIAQNENERYDVEKNIAQNELQIANSLQQIIQFWGSSFAAVDTTNFIDINTIQQHIVDIDTFLIDPTEAQYRQAQKQLAQSELLVKRTANSQVITNFQFGVQDDDKLETFQNPYFRLGVKIPFLENNRYVYNNIALDIKAMEQKIATDNDKLYRTIPLLKRSLQKKIITYQAQVTDFEQSLAKKILQNEKLSSELTALDRMELLIVEQKRKVDLQKTAATIVQDYLTLLLLSGKLTTLPLVNYLDKKRSNW